MGVCPGVYLRLLLAAAHDIPWNPIDSSSELPLPLACSLEELRRSTADLTRADVGFAPGRVGQYTKIDPALADLIEDHSERLDVPYARYIGTILEIAAGKHPAVLGQQSSLLEDEAGPFAERTNDHQEARVAC